MKCVVALPFGFSWLVRWQNFPSLLIGALSPSSSWPASYYCHGSSICPEQQHDRIDLQPPQCCGSALGNLVGAELVIHTLILLICLVTLADSGGERDFHGCINEVFFPR